MIGVYLSMELEGWRETHPLEGPLLKLKWAEKHLKTIDEYLIKYEALNPTSMVCNLNADKTFYEYSLRSLMPPFLDFGIAIGEFSYQVRSAMDHIIYALAEFPATLTPRELDRAERTTSFPISIVDAVQPYQRGNRNQARSDPLALLDEINRIDKHRVFRGPKVTININRADIAPGIKVLATGIAKHGDVFAWIPADLDPKVEFYPRVSTEVVLPVTGPSGRKIQMESLRIIHNRVRNSILPQFVRFFDPLPSSVKI